MGEEVKTFNNLGECFEAAVKLLEKNGINFNECKVYSSSGVNKSCKIGNKGIFGITNKDDTNDKKESLWKLRVDYDEEKSLHINVEVGKRLWRSKAAYCLREKPNVKSEAAYRLLLGGLFRLNTATAICNFIQKEIDNK